MELEIITEKEAQDILEIRKKDNATIKTIEGKDTSLRPLVVIDKLPSGFKGYPKGTVISYDPITLGELEAINNGNTIDKERGIAMLLKAIHCNTLNAYDLYYWDVMFIGIQRKILAFGDSRGLAYGICPKCKSLVSYEFDLTELDFKELTVEDLPVIMKINGKEIEISLLTIKDYLELDKDTEESIDLCLFAKMIKNMPFEEALETVKNATGKEAKALKYIDNMLDYGLKPFFTQCTGTFIEQNPDYNSKDKKSKRTIEKKCKEKVKVEVTSPFEVVFPKSTNEEPLDIEIQFGRK